MKVNAQKGLMGRPEAIKPLGRIGCR